MRFHRKLAVAGAAALAAASVAVGSALAAQATPRAVDTGAKPLASKTIGIFASVGQAEVQKRVIDMTVTAAKALGWKTQYVDGEGDPAKMQQRLQALVSSHVDAIVGVFLEPAVVTAQLQAAKKAGIPVVNAGFVGTPSPLVAGQFIGNQTAMAKLLDAQMAKDLKSGAKLGLINLPQYIGVRQRITAFKADAAAHGWDVVASHDVDLTNLFADTTKAGQDMLNAHPDLSAIYSCCDFGAQALAPAIAQSGKNVPVYSFYAIPSVMDMVRAGKVTVVEEDNAKTGAMAIDQLAAHFANGAKINAAGALKADPIRMKVVTKANAPASGVDVYPAGALLKPYLAKWRKLYRTSR